MLPEVVFETGVEDSRAVLGAPPDLWSYSSLKEAGECPRRFALTRARYPALWDGTGYPTVPNPAALFGNVVHGALEVVVKALVDAGVTSVHDMQATEVLRALGGLSSVIEDMATMQLAPLEGNPRLGAERRRRVSRDLRAQVPDARVQVQSYLSRTAFTVSATARLLSPVSGANSIGRRPELHVGSHAEVRLVADNLRLMGRIDLLTVTGQSITIVDYKSGAPTEGHHEQLRLYALLWDRDVAANPGRRAVDELVAAYREKDVVVARPSSSELLDMADNYAGRVGAAESALRSDEPPATPGEAVCRFCPVRQLCGPYWEQMVPAIATVDDGSWFDYEGVIGSRNGPRSWWVESANDGQRELLLRTSSQRGTFSQGDRVRMLGLRREHDREVTAPVAIQTATTEVFRMTTY